MRGAHARAHLDALTPPARADLRPRKAPPPPRQPPTPTGPRSPSPCTLLSSVTSGRRVYPGSMAAGAPGACSQAIRPRSARTAGLTYLQKTGCERDSPLPTGAEPGGARSCCGVGTGGGAGPGRRGRGLAGAGPRGGGGRQPSAPVECRGLAAPTWRRRGAVVPAPRPPRPAWQVRLGRPAPAVT